MRFAKTCECEHPLTIEEDDFCSSCSRYVWLPEQLPEAPTDNPMDRAIEMRADGHSYASILRETGITQDALTRALNPVAWQERLANKRKKHQERMAKAKRAADQFPELAGKNIDDHPEAFVTVITRLRDEGMSWDSVAAALGTYRDKIRAVVDPEWYERNLERKRAADRAAYRDDPLKRAIKNAYCRGWRELKKLEAQHAA